jgi:hypothetical protein
MDAKRPRDGEVADVEEEEADVGPSLPPGGEKKIGRSLPILDSSSLPISSPVTLVSLHSLYPPLSLRPQV